MYIPQKKDEPLKKETAEKESALGVLKKNISAKSIGEDSVAAKVVSTFHLYILLRTHEMMSFLSHKDIFSLVLTL